MTPAQIKQQAPQGATHYDIQQGRVIYYKVNSLGYTMCWDGSLWYSTLQGVSNYRKIE